MILILELLALNKSGPKNLFQAKLYDHGNYNNNRVYIVYYATQKVSANHVATIIGGATILTNLNYTYLINIYVQYLRILFSCSKNLNFFPEFHNIQ